jgi:hypothetical protein
MDAVVAPLKEEIAEGNPFLSYWKDVLSTGKF